MVTLRSSSSPITAAVSRADKDNYAWKQLIVLKESKLYASLGMHHLPGLLLSLRRCGCVYYFRVCNSGERAKKSQEPREQGREWPRAPCPLVLIFLI